MVFKYGEGEFHSVANDTLERLSMAFEELESSGRGLDLVESVEVNDSARYIYDKTHITSGRSVDSKVGWNMVHML